MVAAHILFTTPAYPPFPGGGERYTAALATRLVQRGYRVSIVTSAAEKESDFWMGSRRSLAGNNVLDNPHIVRCPLNSFPGRRRGLLAWRKAMVVLSSLPGSQSSVLQRMATRIPPISGMDEALAKLENSIDLVHGFNISWEAPLLLGWQYARAKNIPFFVTPFAHLGVGGKDRVALNSTMDHQRQLMAEADGLFALTSIEAQDLQAYGINPGRSAIVGAGLDPLPVIGDPTTLLTALELEEPYILFIGRLSFDKGALHAAQAVLALNKQGVPISLALAGQPTPEFERFFQNLNSGEKRRIRPLGLVDEVTKHTLLRGSALLTLPSRTDSFGIVILEAWAHEKPVVAARAGGIPGVVDDNENGLLVDFGDVSGLSKAFHRLLSDPGQSQRMGENGRIKVSERYNWEKLTDRVIKTYNLVLRTR